MSPLSTASLIGAAATTISVGATTLIHRLTSLVLLPGYLGFTVVMLGIACWTVWGWSFALDRQKEREARRQARALARRLGIDPDCASMPPLRHANEHEATILYPNFGRTNVDYDGERKHA
jgi:hypothetical protein